MYNSADINFWAGADHTMALVGSNVGIGTVSPDEKLDVENGNIRLKSNSDGNTGIFRMYDASGTESGQIYPAGGDLKIYSPNDILFTQTLNVGIGTDSPNLSSNGSYGNKVLTVSGSVAGYAGILELASVGYAGTGGNMGQIQFVNGTSRNASISSHPETSVLDNAFLNFSTKATGGTLSERMRLTSVGQLQVAHGSSSPGATLNLINNGATSPYGISITTPNFSGTGTWQIYIANSVESKMITYMSGTIENRTGVYGTISDGRLKENIVDATPKLDNLMKLKIRNFNFITSEDKHIGLIAQEVEEVFPNLVSDQPDRGEDEEGNTIELETTTKTIKSSLFVPMLIKAMQEQQVMLQELKAEVEILKNKCNCK